MNCTQLMHDMTLFVRKGIEIMLFVRKEIEGD